MVQLHVKDTRQQQLSAILIACHISPGSSKKKESLGHGTKNTIKTLFLSLSLACLIAFPSFSDVNGDV